MAAYSRVGANGWVAGDDSADASRVTAHGWLFVAGTGGGAAITLQSDGSLLYKPSPGGSDNKLYLTSAGDLAAKTAPGAGDRRISLSGGSWLAN